MFRFKRFIVDRTKRRRQHLPVQRITNDLGGRRIRGSKPDLVAQARQKQCTICIVYLLGKLAQHLNAKTCSVVSAIGADAGSSNYYNQTKGEAEELLQSLELNSLRIFRPSMLHGERNEFRLKEAAGFLALTFMSPLLQGRWKKFRAVHVKQVAKSMYESALQDYPTVKIFENDEIQRF